MSVRTMPLNGPQSLGSLGNGEYVSNDDIKQALNQRGYRIYVEVVPHHVIEVPEKPLSKADAILIAVDLGIDGYRLSHTMTHPRMCPTGTCQVDPNVWNSLITWCANAANGYLQGKYALPSWYTEMQVHTSGLGYYDGQLYGVTEWLEDKPWVLTAIASGLAVWRDALTASRVKKLIQESIPKEQRKPDEMAALVSYLQQQGVVPEGKTAIVAAGAQQAAAPSWIMPVAIIGGVGLVLVLMTRK